jgi:hypothetical protein
MSPVRLSTKATAPSAPPRWIPEADGPFGLKSFPCPRLKWGRALTNTPKSSGPVDAVHFRLRLSDSTPDTQEGRPDSATAPVVHRPRLHRSTRRVILPACWTSGLCLSVRCLPQREHGRHPCAHRSDRPKHRRASLRASVSSDRSAQRDCLQCWTFSVSTRRMHASWTSAVAWRVWPGFSRASLLGDELGRHAAAQGVPRTDRWK